MTQETLIKISDLHAETEDQAILKGLNLEVKAGEVHAIMGPNGAGKSTLAKVLAGHPAYEVNRGQIDFAGEDLLELDPEERCHKGFFMSFQYPLEIEGVTNYEFLKSVLGAHRKARGESELSEEQFKAKLEGICERLHIPSHFLDRDLNSGFSGGEKKRNEILQMAVIDPKLAILDETDSGLDIDALRVVSEGINELMDSGKGLILITHYQRLLDYVKPDFVHVMVDGKIAQSGGPELAQELEKSGYEMQGAKG